MIFGALLVWFIVRSVQSIHAWGLHVPHTAVHAVMSLAMLLMYRFPAGAVSHAMSMSASAGGARIDPGLTFLLAFILFGSAVFTIASPNKGATHFGTHCGGIVRAQASDGHAGETTPTDDRNHRPRRVTEPVGLFPRDHVHRHGTHVDPDALSGGAGGWRLRLGGRTPPA